MMIHVKKVVSCSIPLLLMWGSSNPGLQQLTKNVHEATTHTHYKNINTFVNRINSARNNTVRLEPRDNRLLLDGPPGEGKTTECQTAARHTDSQLIELDAQTVVQKYVGDGVQAIKATMSQADKIVEVTQKGVMIFIDEVDCLVSSEDKSHAEDKKAATELCKVLDRYEGNPNYAFVFATNNKSKLLPTFLNRFPADNMVHLPQADLAKRKMVLKDFFVKRDMPTLELKRVSSKAQNVVDQYAQEFTQKTDQALGVLEHARPYGDEFATSCRDFSSLKSSYNKVRAEADAVDGNFRVASKLLVDCQTAATKILTNCCLPSLSILPDAEKQKIATAKNDLETFSLSSIDCLQNIVTQLAIIDKKVQQLDKTAADYPQKRQEIQSGLSQIVVLKARFDADSSSASLSITQSVKSFSDAQKNYIDQVTAYVSKSPTQISDDMLDKLAKQTDGLSTRRLVDQRRMLLELADKYNTAAIDKDSFWKEADAHIKNALAAQKKDTAGELGSEQEKQADQERKALELKNLKLSNQNLQATADRAPYDSYNAKASAVFYTTGIIGGGVATYKAIPEETKEKIKEKLGMSSVGADASQTTNTEKAQAQVQQQAQVQTQPQTQQLSEQKKELPSTSTKASEGPTTVEVVVGTAVVTAAAASAKGVTAAGVKAAVAKGAGTTAAKTILVPVGKGLVVAGKWVIGLKAAPYILAGGVCYGLYKGVKYMFSENPEEDTREQDAKEQKK